MQTRSVPQSPALLLEPASTDGRLDWHALFGQCPVEVEIGIGKGRYLLESAARHAERAYVGIEIVRKYARTVAHRAERRGLDNVRVWVGDAGEFFADRVEPGSLSVVSCYCPDPWHKKRHHRRRLFTLGFLHVIAGALRPGGRFEFVSDYHEYFEEVAAHVALSVVYDEVELTMRRPEDGVDGARTNYERKWLSLGRPVYGLTARRAEASGPKPSQS